MARLRLTDKDVADALGIERTMMLRRRQGKVPFQMAELIPLALFLGHTVDEMLTAAYTMIPTAPAQRGPSRHRPRGGGGGASSSLSTDADAVPQ